jgi:hypothetical protein
MAAGPWYSNSNKKPLDGGLPERSSDTGGKFKMPLPV